MKGGKKIAIAMAVCFCIVVISVGIYFGTKKKPQADKKTDSEPSATDDATPADKKTDSKSSTTPVDKKTGSKPSATPTDKKADSKPSATPTDKKTDSTAPVVNTGSDNLTPVITPVSSGLLDSDSESDDDNSGGVAPVTSTPAAEKSDDDKLMEAFLKDGKGKFNKHLPGYCLNWKKKDQNKGDINYGKKTVAECKKVCFDKGPDGSDELTACEWGKGDVNSTTDRANCIGHTADINRYSASGHDNRICWTTAAPENHDDEKLYGKM
jgi:hypothetical protein